jgi:serine/threonine protein kinase
LLPSLNHPNIAAIHGVQDRALILELVEGATLAGCIKQGPIPIDEALPLIRQLIKALEYAHEKGIVHRDLKPANIKITPEGQLKVLCPLTTDNARDPAAKSPSAQRCGGPPASAQVGLSHVIRVIDEHGDLPPGFCLAQHVRDACLIQFLPVNLIALCNAFNQRNGRTQ